MENKIYKIYDLKSLGSDQVKKDLDAINKSFLEIRKTKLSLNADKARIADPEELKKVNTELANLAKRESEATVKRKELTVALKEQQLIRAQELAQQKQLQSGNQALAGSLFEVQKKYKELYQIARLTINPFNKADVEAAQNELYKLKGAIDNFSRGLTRDKTLVGEYTTGIIQAFQRLGLGDLIQSQMNKAKQSTAALDAEFLKLKNDLQQYQVSGKGNLETIERELLKNRTAAQQTEASLHNMQASLRGVGGIGGQITQGLSQNFKNLKGDIANFVVGYLAFQQVIALGGKDLRINYTLSDSLAQLEIYLHGDKEAVDSLFESLKKLDTRTGLLQLVDIATIIAKKGVAKEEILGVTKAVDQLLVVLGTEVGDPKSTVSSLIKLVNVYSEDKHVTAKNINDIGAAIQKLTSSGVATGEFLINFAERLAGVRGITGVSIQNVLGLGAAIQELGQRSEVAGTAASQLIIKMFSDIPKYAEYAGVSTKKFSDLITKSPVEALITLAEGLKKNKKGLDEIAEAFTGAGIHGARVLGVLGDIAGNAEYMRKRVVDANKAFGDQASLAAANTIKQNNLAAAVDRVSKAFTVIGTSKGFQLTIEATAKAIGVLLTNLPLIISLGALLLAGWIAQNSQLALLRIQTLGYNLAIRGYQIILGLTTIIQTAYTVGLGLLTGAYTRATAAVILFGNAMRLTPLGAILTIVGLLAASVVALGAAMVSATDSLKHYSYQQKLNLEINQKANEATGDQIQKLKTLTAVAKDNNASLEIREKALKDLIAINPKYLSGLTLENLKTAEGTKLLNEYVGALRKKAAFEAALSIQSEKLKKDLKLAEIEYKLQQRVSLGKDLDIDNLSDEEKGFIGSARKKAPFSASVTDIFTGSSPAAEALAGVQNERAKLAQELTITDEVVKAKYVQIALTLDDGAAVETPTSGAERTISVIRADLAKVKKELERATGEQKAVLIKRRTELEAELKLALDKKSPGGDRLSIEERDDLKKIDAEKDRLLQKEELRFAELKKQRQLNVEDEVSHESTIVKIATDALDAKIARIKGGNAAELQFREKLKLERINKEQEGNEKIYKLRLDDLNNQKNYLDLLSKDKLDAVEADSQANDLELAALKVNYFDSLLQHQKELNEAEDALDKQFGRQSEKNATDRARSLLNIQRAFNKSVLDLNKSIVEEETAEIDKRYDDAVNNIKADVLPKLQALFENTSLTQIQKRREFKKLIDDEERKIIEADIVRINQQLDLNKKLYDKKLINAEEYYKKLATLTEQSANAQQGLAQISATTEETFGQKVRDGLAELIWLSGEATSRILGQAQQTEQALQDLLLTSLSNKIEKDYQESISYQDKEKKKRLAQAQSKEEEQAIEAEYDQKQKEAERKRNEARKEVAKKQLAIEFALASIKAISTSTDIYEGLIKEALVALEYFAKLQIINSQQFKDGGKVDDIYERGGGLRSVLTSGGIFDGPSHANGGIRFGRNEVEGQEAYVISKKAMNSGNRYSVSGTPSQIASAANVAGGGVNFSPGARMIKFEYGGNLGMSLKPPQYVANYYASGGKVMDNSEEMIRMFSEGIFAINARIDRIQVVLNPNAVSNYQYEYSKAVKLGTL